MIQSSDFQSEYWQRMQYDDTPIYLSMEEPDWFVPTKSGDEVIQAIKNKVSLNGNPYIHNFLHTLPKIRPLDYQGRSAYLGLEQLNELWFHITNRCNLSCSHCLFASSPKENSELKSDDILKIAEDAVRIGCRVFVLTGGEPFVHPEIDRIINGLLSLKDNHLVILTNGMNLNRALDQKWIDSGRLHLQISVDGIGPNHDRIRGEGAFQKLSRNLKWAKEHNIPYTLSMCVTRYNVEDMSNVIDFAAHYGAGNVHFMWYFVRGRGKNDGFAPIDLVFENFLRAAEKAEKNNITIDNIESLKTQVFAPRGTIHDGTTSAWESLAVGPDRQVYPSAALVGIPELSTDLSMGLEKAWRQSPVLKNIREATAVNLTSPFRFILAGGDMDHSYIHKKTFMGDDPYIPLYEKIALWLIARESSRQAENGIPQLKLRMGEILESCGAHGKVALAHSNCLLATAAENSLSVVKSFYSQAVGDQKEDILNPVCYDESILNHVPEEFRFRGYGCGSPVMDAGIQEGECVVDLGCGTGVECFIASRITGETGRVIGVDMLDPMLELANKAHRHVADNLGYDNLEFRKGYLENLPVDDNSADVVISNCVMNLSVHKRRAFSEILRILRPGGRLVISDVVCETEPDPAIRNDENLRGECIAGALTQEHLISLLHETGFIAPLLIKRFPYREVQGHPFYSLTFSAVKPKFTAKVPVIYRGPLPYIVTHDGETLFAGEIKEISSHEAETLKDQLFIIDGQGNVTNIEAENTCSCCSIPPEKSGGENLLSVESLDTPIFTHDCMLCGAPLEYLPEEKELQCVFCHKTFFANSMCQKGHFVCDSCHTGEAFEVINQVCINTNETDMISLLKRIRSHPRIPVHGPEHHAIVPGIILSTYRNLGGEISTSVIQTGIRRGKTVSGGHCAFMGACGAAIGVGIAFSLILEATPLTPKERKIVQNVTQITLKDIARFKAARCCQRDSWIALKKAAELSEKYLNIQLKAEDRIECNQKEINKECLGKGCPLY